jgi:hypothetical protein
MADIYNIPSAFLKEEGFPVVDSMQRLSCKFDDRMDDEFEWLRIPSIDGVDIDAQFSPSEALYRLDRREYDRAFEQWSMQYVALSDGGYLHKDYEQSASDSWVVEMEKKKSKWKEKREG